MAGVVWTVSMTAVVIAEPMLLVKTARYSLPSRENGTLWRVSVVEVAPLRSVQVVALPLRTCHFTVGVGLPLVVAVKVAVLPAITVWLLGFIVMVGANSTVSVAAAVVVVPMLLVKTARYSSPFWEDWTLLSVSVALVAPLILLN